MFNAIRDFDNDSNDYHTMSYKSCDAKLSHSAYKTVAVSFLKLYYVFYNSTKNKL